MAIIPAAIAGGSAIVGGVMDMLGQSSANKTSIELANTQYQRSVKDMTKAGLNPMMMLGKGAGGPAPTPNIQSTTRGLGESVGSAGKLAAIDAPVAAAGIVKTQADTANSMKDLQVKDTQIGLLDAQTKAALSQDVVNSANALSIRENLSKIPHDIALTDALAGKAGQEAKVAARNVLVATATAKELAARTALEEQQHQKGAPEAAAAGIITPAVKAGGKAIGGLAKDWVDPATPFLQGSQHEYIDDIRMWWAKTLGQIQGTMNHMSKKGNAVYGGANSAKDTTEYRGGHPRHEQP